MGQLLPSSIVQFGRVKVTESVLGNLPFPGVAAGQGGDQFVSKAASAAIAALLKRIDKLDVQVKAEPVSKLLQGSLDGFDFMAQGMEMYSGLRVQVMELYVQAVSIDFSAIFQGQVKLRQPTQATMRVVLSQDDLTTSFNTPFLMDKLQLLESEGQPLHFQNTQVTINDDQSLRLQSDVQVASATQPTAVDFTTRIDVVERRRLQFVDVNYSGDTDAVALGQSITNHLNELLDLDQFALDGMQLRIDQLRLRNQKMTLYGIAHFSKFPQRKV